MPSGSGSATSPQPTPPVAPAATTPAPQGSTTVSSGVTTALNGPFPEELKGWNWGAFYFNWLWGLNHKVWLSLLVFIPMVGIVMPFILGAKGNEWAWQNRKFASIDEFKAVQHAWAKWALIVFLVSLVLSVLAVVSLMTLVATSPTTDYSSTSLEEHSDSSSLTDDSGLLDYSTQ